MLDKKKATKYIYDQLIHKKGQQPKETMDRWRQELDISTTDKEILKSLNDQRLCTINHKLRSFNFNFFHRNIPYQSRLHKMKIKDHPNCDECNCKETLTQIYWECPFTKRLSERLKLLVETNPRTCFNLNPEKCLLGTGVWYSNRNKETLHFLTLLTKHYIHLSKCCENNTRSPQGLELYIKSKLRLEWKISTEKGTHNWFTEKWREWIQWMEN